MKAKQELMLRASLVGVGLIMAWLAMPAVRADSFSVVGSLNTARSYHMAVLLQNGEVLVAGKDNTGKWSLTASMGEVRDWPIATLMPNGEVLVAQDGADVYEAGLGFSNLWQPQITTIMSPLSIATSLTVTGMGFRGVSGGSYGGGQDSPTDYPLVQLRSLESGQTRFLPATNWSTNSFASVPVTNFPPGYALATVFVNGIPSASSIVNISVPVPTPPVLTNAGLAGGAFQFGFTNSPGALFGVWETVDLTVPQTNWTPLGGVTEISPGNFQFTDSQSTNGGQRFYSVRAP